jgi:hypothetical protein
VSRQLQTRRGVVREVEHRFERREESGAVDRERADGVEVAIGTLLGRKPPSARTDMG